MSRSSKPYDEANASVPREKIEGALREMAEYRKQVIYGHAAGFGIDERTARGFHASVINTYTELTTYREHRTVKKKWENARLWQENGQWVTGLSSLDEWIHKTGTAKEPKPGRRAGTKEVSKPVYLPPMKAYRVSLILDDVAKELGIAIETDSGPRPAGLLDEREPQTNSESDT